MRTLETRWRVARRMDSGSKADGEKSLHDVAERVQAFVLSNRMGAVYRYRYARSCTQPTLYASAYACLTLSLIGALDRISAESKGEWIAYLDGFQSERDGLFYDPVVDSELYRTSDWWGARHAALHVVNAYAVLGGRPKYPLTFLRRYYDARGMTDWLDGFNWSDPVPYDTDFDNQIMNVGCLLQYQRDAWGDSEAAIAVARLQEQVLDRVNPRTGTWGAFDPADPVRRSRMIQFAYHVLPLLLYDRVAPRSPGKIVESTLATQNGFGGFGVAPNSSACEDIDSIDLLFRLAPAVEHRREEIATALTKAVRWVLANQLDDGGFGFRLHEPFAFGHRETSSRAREGAMFPTWFRTLSLAYLGRYLELPNPFVLKRCPGYEY